VTAESPIFVPGDVVYGVDPYKRGESGRPWLIIENHEGRPFHGEQYIALSLTTRTWMDGLVNIDDDDWIRGGTPDESRIIPWGVQSFASEDIDFWQGRLTEQRLTDALEALIAYFQP